MNERGFFERIALFLLPIFLALASGLASAGAGIDSSSWTALGPDNLPGRIRAIAIHPTQPAKMWVGSGNGGIWKTTDGGASWSKVNDFLPSLVISAIVLSSGNPDVMYATTGDRPANLFPDWDNRDYQIGAGILKSTDGGTTWATMPSTDPANPANASWRHINALAIHPTNGNIMLAATFTDTFRSTDAGSTWTRVTGGTRSIQFDPVDGNKALAATVGSTIRYSSDGGITWQTATLHQVEPALPLIGFSPGGGVAYATVASAVSCCSLNGQVYRSTDSGASFTLVGSLAHPGDHFPSSQAIWVDPTNSNHLILGGRNLHRSIDGGATWTPISDGTQAGSVPHGHHAIVSGPGYNGTTNRTIYFGTAAGLYRAADIQAVTATNVGWTALNNGLATTEFYSVVGHAGLNGRVIGGTQNAGSLVYSGVGMGWTPFIGGEGGRTAIDPGNGNVIFGTLAKQLHVYRSTTGAGPATDISGAIASPQDPDRSNVAAPITMDPNHPEIMWAGGVNLWRSDNVRAATPAWSKFANGDGSQIYAAMITDIAVAKTDSNQVWFGRRYPRCCDDFQLFKAANALGPFPNLTGFTFANAQRDILRTILIDKDDANTVYVSFGGSVPGVNGLWRTTNGGATWTRIGGTLRNYIRTLERHPQRADYLYAGTDAGIITSVNGGLNWSTVNDGPANVRVDRLYWIGNTLYAATHGRGVFRATVAAEPAYTLTITKAGTGSGPVTSSPAGIVCGSACSAGFTAGTVVTLTATANAGSAFAGWSGACSGTATTCTLTVSAVTNVTATFNKAANQTLTIFKSGTGSGPVTSNPAGIVCGSDCSQSYAYGTSVTLSASSNSGSVFAGWSGACTGAASTCVVTMNAAKSVTATFNRPPVTLTVTKTGATGLGLVTSSPAGINCGSTCSAAFAGGSNVTLTASIPTASEITWSGACSGSSVANSSTCVVPMTSAKSVGVSFTVVRGVEVTKTGSGSGTVTSSPAGISCGAACFAYFPRGSTVTLTATPAARSAFIGWNGACTGAATSCVLTIDDSNTVSATFLSYEMTIAKAGEGTGTVVSSPAGIDCGAVCSNFFGGGTTVNLTATAGAGSVFAGWSTACGTSPTCAVSMGGPRNLTATFTAAPLPLDDALDNTALSWSTSGNVPWFGQSLTTFDGVDAARSGAITHKQASVLSTTVNGPGTLSFRWRVSSEAGFDFLTFYIGGIAQAGPISGESGWLLQSVSIPFGSTPVEWRYTKDATNSVGQDRGWVDQVQFAPTFGAPR